MKRPKVASIIALVSCCLSAHADVTATKLSGNGVATVTGSSGIWNVIITIPTTFTSDPQHRWLIEADDDDAINLIRVDSCPTDWPGATKPTHLIIRPVGSGSITSLGSIVAGTGACSYPGSDLVIEELEVNGDFNGSIQAYFIDSATIGGSAYGTISAGISVGGGVLPASSGIASLFIGGDLRNTIFSDSPIERIEISGNAFKDVNDVSVTAFELGRLTASSFAGYINVDGPVGRIEISDAFGTPDLRAE